MGRWLGVVAVAVVVACPLLYATTFSGDAVIHLAYAERTAAGHPFEFNAGEISSGETSPGYMLLVAACFKLFPAAAVPVVVKALDLAAWYLLAFVVWQLARRLLNDPVIAAGVAFIAAIVPGSVYNATIGMENGVFALALFAALLVHLRGSGAPSVRTEITCGLLFGAAIWLRPEGVVAAALWYGLRTLPWRRDRLMPIAAGLAVVVIADAALAWLELTWTGTLMPASGRSRLWLSTLQSVALGPVMFDPSLLTRFAVYAPFMAPAFAGVWFVARRPPASDVAWRYLAALLVAFTLLYSTVLGAAHPGRYAIFLMPAACLLAGRCVEHAGWRTRRAGRFALAGLAVALASVFVTETIARARLSQPGTLLDTMQAPAQRGAATDALLTTLGAPRNRTIQVAIDDVDVRYAYDDRVVVRALDGRTDDLFFEFVEHGTADYAGYLRARGVDYVLAFPAFNRDTRAWTPATLLSLAPGEEAVQAGLHVRRLQTGSAVRIVR